MHHFTISQREEENQKQRTFLVTFKIFPDDQNIAHTNSHTEWMSKIASIWEESLICTFIEAINHLRTTLYTLKRKKIHI